MNNKTPDAAASGEIVNPTRTGEIATAAHIPAALACPGVEVRALVDPAAARAKKTAKRFSISCEIRESIEDLPSDLDGAVIAAPNHLHRDLALQCLSHGLHILVEKPMGRNINEGREIVDAAKDAGLVLAAGYCTRFLPAIELLQKTLQAETFGCVKRFLYQFGSAGSAATRTGYSMNRSSAGGGVLIVNGIHFIERAIHWFGMPQIVAYEDDARGGPESRAEARLRFDRGASPIDGLVRLTKNMKLPSGLVLETDQGAISLGDGVSDELRFFPANSSEQMHVIRDNSRHSSTSSVQMYTDQLTDFVTACRHARRPRVDGETALLPLELIDALYVHASRAENVARDDGSFAVSSPPE